MRNIQFERVQSADPHLCSQNIIRLTSLISGIFSGSVFYFSVTQGNFRQIIWVIVNPYP